MIERLPFEPVSVFHDFELFSIFYGEAFLFEDYIYYFDGKDARIIGYNKSGEAIQVNHLKELMKHLKENYKAETISVECPSSIPQLNHSHYKKRKILLRPNLTYDFEILIYNTHYNLEKLRKKNLRFDTDKFIIKSSPIHLTYEHLLMIEKFITRWEGTCFYKSEFISSIYYLTSRKTSKIINCFYKEKLVGFSIVSSVNQIGFLHNHITLNEVNGISDILYYEAIKQLLNEHVSIISLGFSLNKGLYNFKKKWGGTIHWKGGYEILWYKNKKVSQYLWATRIVRKN